MGPLRPRLPSPAMAVALLALFVALSGGAYAAAKIGAGDIKKDAIRSKHIKANAVKLSDLATMARFTRKTGHTPVQPVLRLAGLEIRYGCLFDGVVLVPRLTAHTTVDDVYVSLAFTTGIDGFGQAFVDSDLDLDRGESFSLDRGRASGQGTLLYTRPNGKVVSVTYGFERSGSSFCRASGVAAGG
jgi:hypothetical protein